VITSDPLRLIEFVKRLGHLARNRQAHREPVAPAWRAGPRTRTGPRTDLGFGAGLGFGVGLGFGLDGHPER
jgi:hypothetical protein